MTSQEKFDILNSYNGIMSKEKWLLAQTDWQVVKATEIDGEEPEDVKARRIEARAIINQYEEWIKEIEAIEPDDPEPPYPIPPVEE